MQGVAVGRIVHYVDTQEHRAAIICNVIDQEQGIVDLVVLDASLMAEMSGNTAKSRRSIRHSDNKEYGTWHRPEYIP